MASSPDTAANPNSKSSSKPSSSSSRPGSTTSGPRRRRGGPGGPVPVTNTSSNGKNPLHIDMSGLRISDTTSISGHSEALTTASSGAGTTSSGRRRRRRRNNKQNNALAKVVENANNNNGGFGNGGGLPPIPSSSKSGKKGEKKPAKLNIGLDLNVELELKAKLSGDLSLSLVVEEKAKRRDSPELRCPGEGEYVVTELFYMRVGTLRLRRRWIDPEAVLRGQVFLTALSAAALLLAGFALGWAAARWSAGMPLVAGGASSSFWDQEYYGGYYAGEGHTITTSSWVENVAFGPSLGNTTIPPRGAGGCDCDCNNTYIP